MRRFVERRSEVAGGQQPLQRADADGQRWVVRRPEVAGGGSRRPRDGQPARRRQGPLPREPALWALASHGRRCVSGYGLIDALELRIDAVGVGVGVGVTNTRLWYWGRWFWERGSVTADCG